MLNDLQFAEATKVAVVREFALLHRHPRRVASAYAVSLASVYRWKDDPALVETATRRTSVKVLRAELIAAEATLQWMGLGRWVSSVTRDGLIDKSALIDAIRGARRMERQAVPPRSVRHVSREAVYRFIRDRMGEFPAATACKAFGIARSGYYAWLRCGGKRFDEDQKLRSAIVDLVDELGGSASYRRISERLRSNGVVCSRHRVKRLLDCSGLGLAASGDAV